MKNKKIYIIILLVLIVAIGCVLTIMKNQKKIEEEKNQKQYLSEEELTQFEEFLEDTKNNSFLYCEYQNPNEIDLTQLLSEGAGINIELTDEQKKEYNEKIMEQIGEFPQVPLLISVKKEDIEKLVKEKTGKEITQIETKLKDWIFIEDGQLYVQASKGNNYSEVECRIGTKKEDIYTIYLKFDNPTITKSTKVKLKKQGDTYLFISNEFIKD